MWCHGFRRKNETRQHDMVLYLIEEMQKQRIGDCIDRYGKEDPDEKRTYQIYGSRRYSDRKKKSQGKMTE